MKKKKILSGIGCRSFALFLSFCPLLEINAVDSVLVRVKGHSMTLTQVVQQIEKNSDYSFFYNSDDLSGNVKKDFDCNGTIEEVLKKVFESSGIEYKIQGKDIILVRNEEENAVRQQQKKKQRNITGHVSDETGLPLVGVNVVVKGTTTGVITDLDGNYTIPFSGESGTLEFSYIGCKTQSIYVTDQGVINVKMVSDNEMLGEVVVVGAGTQKKVSVTGSIAAVKGAELKIPSSSLTTALAGKLSGVIAVTNSGAPGETSDFYIRGVSTFGGRATPLILLDGVEISSGDLNNLPAESIESFSILKDASATAIYGARGANGVMLITTKSGIENSKARVNASFEYSFQQPTKLMEFVDGATWMEMYNEAMLTRNPTRTPRYSQSDIDMTRSHVAPYAYPDIDWYDLMFKDMTMNQRANINVQGGGSKVSYYLSLQANHDTGMLNIPQNYSLKNNINTWNYTFQNNIDYRLTSSTKIGLRMNAQVGHYTGPKTDVNSFFSMVYEDSNPIAIVPYFPAAEGDKHIRFGNAYWSGESLYKNPYAEMLNSFKEKNSTTLNTSLNLEQKLDFVTKGLKLTALVNLKAYAYNSYDRSLEPYYYQVDRSTWNPDNPNTFLLSRVGTSGKDYIDESGISRYSDNTFYFDVRLDYNRSFGRHNVGGLLMYMQREFRSDVNPHRNQGLSGRLTYDFDHRYLVEFNFGYNGTERLAKGKRFEFFPAMSLGWVASGEKFWEPIRPYVNHLKIRGSYGLVGNDETGSDAGAPHFLYFDDVTIGGSGSYSMGVRGTDKKSGPGFNRYAIQDACWERAKKLDIGIDFELFNQVSITADFFHEKRDRILMQRASWPIFMGYTNAIPWSNIGEVTNKGFELSLNWRKEIVKDLHIDFRGNFTYTANKYDYIDEPEYPYTWKSETGKPISATYGYIAEGLFTSQDEINNSPKQDLGSTVMVGDIKYRDIDGDGIINENDQVLLSPYNGSTPRIQYGLGLNVTYKKLDVGVFFNGSAKRTLMMNNITPFCTDEHHVDHNIMTFIAEDYWSEDNPNPNAAYPRLGLTYSDVNNNMVASSYWMRNGNFIRFKNFQVGYSFPYCRVYVSGENLAVWSPFKNWDPEVWWNKYPLQRTFCIGAQINF